MTRLNSTPAFSLSAPVTAVPKKAARNHLVRIKHPQEDTIVALLENVAAGGEDVASKMEEAIELLTGDGIYASFSTTVPNQMNPGGPQVPIVDDNGVPSLQGDQFLLYGRKPGTAEQGEAQVIYRPWNSRGSRRGFVKAFMDFAVSSYRSVIGVGTPAPVATQQVAAPVVSGGQEVILR